MPSRSVYSTLVAKRPRAWPRIDGFDPVLDICKEIIKVVPERSSAWNEIAAAIESTDVVMGEYGMVRAYEAKREEIAAWKSDEHPRVQSFAIWLTESLDQLIIAERQRADAGVALRKHRYGVSKDKP